jgi:uncharacterized membrane protein
MNVSATLTSVLIFLIMDATYISIIRKSYLNMIKKIQCDKVVELNIGAMILCYTLLIISLVFYVIPYMQLKHVGTSVSSKLQTAVFIGGTFGALVYGIFSTTNISLFKDFDIKIALIDVLWGGILFTGASMAYMLLV